MKTATNITLLCLLILYSLNLVGCGKKQDADVPTDADLDVSKPISEVKAEADKMDADQLRAAAVKYKDAIEAKEAEVDKLAKDLMKVAVADKSSEKMKQLNAQMTKINESVEVLAARFQIYLEALKAKGGDVSGLEM